jgi:hypothetical protein
MSEVTTLDVPGFPQDILDAALAVEDEIMEADITDLDTQYIIAKAIMAERTRCAELAAYEARSALAIDGTEDARGAAYYASQAIENGIRNPVTREANPAVEIDADDLPF